MRIIRYVKMVPVRAVIVDLFTVKNPMALKEPSDSSFIAVNKSLNLRQ